MFSKKKKLEEPQNWQAKTPAPAQVSMVDRLRSKRAEKVRQANGLDAEIATLDQEISWMERHPFGALIIEKFYHEAKDVAWDGTHFPSYPDKKIGT